MVLMGAALGAIKAAQGVSGAAKATSIAKKKPGFVKGALGALGRHEKENFGLDGKQGTEKKQQPQSPSRRTNFAADWGAIPKMKKGGPIRKTGVYMLHKGEYVVPASGRSKARSSKKVSHKKR